MMRPETRVREGKCSCKEVRTLRRIETHRVLSQGEGKDHVAKRSGPFGGLRQREFLPRTSPPPSRVAKRSGPFGGLRHECPFRQGDEAQQSCKEVRTLRGIETWDRMSQGHCVPLGCKEVRTL